MEEPNSCLDVIPEEGMNTKHLNFSKSETREVQRKRGPHYKQAMVYYADTSRRDNLPEFIIAFS